MRWRRHQLCTFALLVGAACCQAGCDQGTAATHACDSAQGPPCPVAAPPAEVGFVELPSVEYWLGEVVLQSSQARIFYAYLPAQNPTTRTPTFVLTGGGPEGSTMFLFASQGQMALVGDGAEPMVGGANPWALTQLGHVVYLDARNAGYSYALLDAASDQAARALEFSPDNFNVYRDAADTWLALFGFWQRHPELENQPVFLMTESYGGMRVTAMLDMFLRAGQPEGQHGWLHDPALEAELGRRVGGGLPMLGQILLQAVFTGRRQMDVAGEQYEREGSMLDQLAAQAGVPYLRCAQVGNGCDRYLHAIDYLASIDRSPYDYNASWAWLDGHIQRMSNAATRRQTAAALFGVEVARLDGVLGGTRTGAYRFIDPMFGTTCPRGDLEQSYGAVEPWDAHFVGLNREALDIFYRVADVSLRADGRQEAIGELFLGNLRSIPTMASRAERDLVVYGDSLAPALASYPQVQAAVLTGDEIRVDFTDGVSRKIWSPRYPSSHSIARDAPAQLFADLTRFVEESSR